MSSVRVNARCGLSRFRLALLVVTLALVGIAAPVPVLAQTDGPATGSTVRVSNTNGQSLNLRSGPGTDQAILAKLPGGATLTVTGAAKTVGATRWLPVRTASGQTGWVAAEFVAAASAPASTATPVPSPDAAASAAAQASERAASERSATSERTGEQGRPVDVEAKLKYPETSGREQEITVFVTRGGVPVPGVIVTLETDDGDEDERFRQLDPTDDEGRTRREFDVRHEKGSVELRIEAVAPDGGEGRTTASYFRR